MKSLDCKVELASVYTASNDFGYTLKAKEIYKECINCCKKEKSEEAKKKYLEVMNEFIKFLIKQNDEYDVSLFLEFIFKF